MTFLIVPVVLCSAYLVMVAVCVCERMTAQTNHLIRLLVGAIGGSGFWALCKAVETGWGTTREDFVQGCAIVVLALVIGLAPRIRTECSGSRVMNDRPIKR